PRRPRRARPSAPAASARRARGVAPPPGSPRGSPRRQACRRSPRSPDRSRHRRPPLARRVARPRVARAVSSARRSGRRRRPVGGRPCSDLEELLLLAGEQGVDGVGVLLGQRVELVLRAVDLVLAGLAVLDDAVELLLGATADVADRHARLLALALGELDVLLAALL